VVAVAIVVVAAALAMGVGDEGGATAGTAAGDGAGTTASPDGGDDAADGDDEADDDPATDDEEVRPVEPPVVSLPPTVAFVRDGRELVLHDTATGETRSILTQPEADPDDPLGPNSFGRVILHPSGEEVFVEEIGEPVAGVIIRVPLRGGDPEAVALGSYPALSPDGRYLATSQLGGGIDVLDLDTLDPRTIAGPPDATGVVALNLAWGHDGRTLFFERAPGPGVPSELWALDAGTASSLDEARRLGPPEGRDGWTLPAPRRDGELVVMEQCCTTSELAGSANGAVVDADDGTVQATFLVERAVLDTAYDATGTFLLYVLVDGRVRWQGGGQGGDLITGATAADW
jgi:hypothetical protein